MKDLNDKFTKSLKEYVEAWFDYHPEPENLELFEIPKTLGRNTMAVSIFAADQVLDTYMIKITFKTMTKRVEAGNYLYEISQIMNVEMVGIGRNLFIFTDRRF